jgi:hypothetical protein
MDSFTNSTVLGYVLLIGLLVVVTMNITTTIPTPNNAIVFANDSTKHFYPEPCMSNQIDRDNLYRLRKTVYQNAIQNEMTVAPECTFALTQLGPSWFGLFLQNVHLMAPPVSRWEEDGTWKY